jgi:hypothetical protein
MRIALLALVFVAGYAVGGFNHSPHRTTDTLDAAISALSIGKMPETTILFSPRSREELIAMIKDVPPNFVHGIGYVGSDGNWHALHESDLRCE